MALEGSIGIIPGVGGVIPTEPVQIQATTITGTQKFAIGSDTFRLNSASVCGLPNIPPQALSAILVLEAAPDAVNANVVLGRFFNDGTWPNNVEGMPMYDGAVIEISSRLDLQRMRIFTTDGKNHKINIQYYSGL